VADVDQRAELALDVRPNIVVGPAAAQLGAELLVIGDQFVEADRRAGRGDDRRHGARVARPEPVDEQGFEIAERHAAVDRPARGEGDDQRIGPPGRTDRLARRILDPRQARLQFGDPRRRGRIAGVRRHQRGRQPLRRADHRRRRRRDAEQMRGAVVAGEHPGRRRRADDDQRQRDQRYRAPAQTGSGRGRVHCPQ
jgi:hypothetical protein